MTDTSITTLKLPVEMKKKLKKIAIDEDTSLSGLIINMIKKDLENRDKNEVNHLN